MYDTTHLRRQDRAMDEQAATRLLAEAQHAVLAMQNICGGAYAVPMDYVWDGGKFIYMHCAPQGYKLECLAACPAVSLVITGAARTLPHMFSTAYESLVVQGECLVVDDAAEKRNALHLLLRKYTPEHLDRGYAYAERALEHTTVLRLCISTWCGKAHLARS